MATAHLFIITMLVTFRHEYSTYVLVLLSWLWLNCAPQGRVYKRTYPDTKDGRIRDPDGGAPGSLYTAKQYLERAVSGGTISTALVVVVICGYCGCRFIHSLVTTATNLFIHYTYILLVSNCTLEHVALRTVCYPS